MTRSIVYKQLKMTRIGKDKEEKIKNLIVYILRTNARPLSTNEIAETLARSWDYTRKLLQRMEKQGMVRLTRRGRYKYWSLH